jgi:hypothetical protein
MNILSGRLFGVIHRESIHIGEEVRSYFVWCGFYFSVVLNLLL